MFAIDLVALAFVAAVVVAAAVEGLARDWHRRQLAWLPGYAYRGAVYGEWSLTDGCPLNDRARRIDRTHADLMALIDGARGI